MARRANTNPSKKKTVARVADAVKKTAKKLTAKMRGSKTAAKAAAPPRAAQSGPERKRRPQSDIPLETLENTYTPQQTSLKGPFRADGADRQDDQEFARGVADDRWNDEDHLTNKSGDSRIGTHGRTYEPGESRLDNGRK